MNVLIGCILLVSLITFHKLVLGDKKKSNNKCVEKWLNIRRKTPPKCSYEMASFCTNKGDAIYQEYIYYTPWAAKEQHFKMRFKCIQQKPVYILAFASFVNPKYHDGDPKHYFILDGNFCDCKRDGAYVSTDNVSEVTLYSVPRPNLDFGGRCGRIQCRSNFVVKYDNKLCNEHFYKKLSRRSRKLNQG